MKKGLSFGIVLFIAGWLTLSQSPSWPAHAAVTAPATQTVQAAPRESFKAPVTAHPRLWLTQSDLPRLRSWATPSNPMWQNGLLVALNNAVSIYNTQFYPGGNPNPIWPDGGTSNFELYAAEAYAQFFAFMSLVDPSANARITHAVRARNLLMHAINTAVSGPEAASQPFRDPQFITFNRGNWWGEAWGLTVDWIYDAKDGNGDPLLTDSDKATIRAVFMRWCNDLLTAYQHPIPVGVQNSPSLLNDKTALRSAANNYFAGHMRNMTLMSMSVDPADDPPITSTASITALGNSLRSYFTEATGAWLYQQYATFEQSPQVISDYGLPANTTGLGMATGGLSVEGFLYGHSLGYLTEALLGLHTAGYDDPALIGPQAKLLQSSYWDKMVDGYLESITPISYTMPGYAWMGPIHQMMSYGDVQHFYLTPDHFATFGALAVYDQSISNTARLDRMRWFTTYALQGAETKLFTRAGSNIWGNALASDAILYFMMYDPARNFYPPDPRPSLPTAFYSASIGRLLARTDWTPHASWISMKCGWETINHQIADCGQVEFYRKGEWLTKEHTSYSDDGTLTTTDFHNTLSIQNHCACPTGQPANLQWFEGPTWDRGSQWTNAQNAGDPYAVASWSGRYAFEYADGTNLYNRPSFWTPANDASDVTHASRSVVWLMPDILVIYDRATTKHNGFKRFSLNLPYTPTLDAQRNLATETLPSGQKLYIQTVQPVAASYTITPVGTWGAIAEFDPIQSRLVVEDPANPLDARLLHVLQGADAAVAPVVAAPLQTISGTSFSGVVISNTAILFPLTMGRAPTATIQGAPFTGTTYLVPGDTTAHLITGLHPGAIYDIVTQTIGLSVQVTILPGGSQVSADSAGVLALGTQAVTFQRRYLPVMLRN